jgi:hypothetical protein
MPVWQCECYRNLLKYVPSDIAGLIQSYVHEKRENRYPIKKIKHGNGSIRTDEKNIGIIRIQVKKYKNRSRKSIAIGSFSIIYCSYHEYMDHLYKLFNSGIDHLLKNIDWTDAIRISRHNYLPLLREFYADEQNQYMYEIHGLTNGFTQWIYDRFDGFMQSMHFLQICDGSSALRYSV